MRNATSILLFGATGLCFTLVGACGGGGTGSRDDDGSAGTATNTTAGTAANLAGSGNASAGSSSGGGASGGGASGGASSGGAAACNPMPGPKKGDGTNMVIDEIDGANTMFAPAGVGSGSWDFSKDTSAGTITPAGTMALAPTDGGHAGKGLHVKGDALTGWGASLAAFLNGPTSSFDASGYGGVAFWIKGSTSVQEGADKIMVQARMPDVLPGAGSCCNDKVLGSECYSGHRVVIGITADWTEVKIPWSEFKGPAWGLGSTLAFNANRVRDINFSFNHDSAAMTGAGSAFDVWIDGVRFMSKDEVGNVMPLPSGGSSSGGSSAGGSGGGSAGGAGGGSSGMGGTQ